MHRVLILGAGRIGSLVGLLLKQADYEIIFADVKSTDTQLEVVNPLDITDEKAVEHFFKINPAQTLVACLPYYHTLTAAQIAKKYQMNYVDFTEDHSAGSAIKLLAKKAKTAFVPHCGVAPGLSGILANHLIQQFSQVDQVRVRVGGLPQYAHNVLHYAITWSVDGLINEYGNVCQSIENTQVVLTKPLEDLEELEIDGMLYEAFNTSGGLGNLIDIYAGKVNHMNYKTIRYPGHCEKIRFLMNDLKLNSHRPILKNILENALPETEQDVVLVDISVIGKRTERWQEESIVKKYYPKQIGNKTYSALQMITAASACTVMDVILKHPQKYQGLIYQESIPMMELQESKFFAYL